MDKLTSCLSSLQLENETNDWIVCLDSLGLNLPLDSLGGSSHMAGVGGVANVQGMGTNLGLLVNGSSPSPSSATSPLEASLLASALSAPPFVPSASVNLLYGSLSSSSSSSCSSSSSSSLLSSMMMMRNQSNQFKRSGDISSFSNGPAHQSMMPMQHQHWRH